MPETGRTRQDCAEGACGGAAKGCYGKCTCRCHKCHAALGNKALYGLVWVVLAMINVLFSVGRIRLVGRLARL